MHFHTLNSSRYSPRTVPTPARRAATQNVLESEYRALRSSFMRLRHKLPDYFTDVAAVYVQIISNDFYSSHVLSSYEMAKLHTPPLSLYPQAIPTSL